MYTNVGIYYAEQSWVSIVHGEVGQVHLLYPHTNSSLVHLRNNIFHINTCLHHINYSFLICKEAVKNGIVSFTVISDNRQDYNPTSYKNKLLYFEIWKESKLDCVMVISSSTWFLAFKLIENFWSPLSNCLTSLTFDACIESEEIPPYLDTKLDNQEKEKQNQETLNMEAKTVALYWTGVTFDNYPIVSIPIPLKDFYHKFPLCSYSQYQSRKA